MTSSFYGTLEVTMARRKLGTTSVARAGIVAIDPDQPPDFLPYSQNESGESGV